MSEAALAVAPLLDLRQAVVDCIYSSAVEPVRFEYLIDNWDKQLREAAYSNEALSLLGTSALFEHVSRAGDVAQSVPGRMLSSIAELAVNRIQTAAFISSRAGEIKAANKAAESVFKIAAGMTLANLHLSPDGFEHITATVQHVISAAEAGQEILRLKTKSNSRLIFTFISVLPAENGVRHALIVTTEQVWQKQIEHAFKLAFKFTQAEINILRMILSGVCVSEIADMTGKTESTVRSQIHSLLTKTGARSQTELLSLTLAFQGAIGTKAERPESQVPTPPACANPYESFRLPDGRRLDYMRLGDPNGRPFIWLHGNLSQCRLTRGAETWLRDKRIDMVVPIRAGYGFSSPRPKNCRAIETAIADIACLRRHLNIGSGPLVAHGNDFMLACSIAARFPASVNRIIGIGSAFAIESAEDYETLGKWARLFRANARFAPKVLVFLGKCTLALVRSIGFETYTETVLRGTPDAEAFRDPEIRAAVIAGSEILFGPEIRPFEAFAADTIAVHRDPWPKLETLNVPVTLMHGEQDPNSSFQSAVQHCQKHPGWRMISFPDAGHFVHHAHWRQVVQIIAESIPA
jgi:pimeloyl-ACP methyl ester carboxylesterase/DNA-binding CsgD family transcriptional regulator